VSTYARPPDQGAPYVDGYAWIQNVLQYTIRSVDEGATDSTKGATDSTKSVNPTVSAADAVALHFGEGGQQVNSYSWVMGAANIQNGSRFFVENVPEELDFPGEYYHDVDEGWVYLIPPVGTPDPNTAQVVSATTQSIIQVKGAGPTGVVAFPVFDPDYNEEQQQAQNAAQEHEALRNKAMRSNTTTKRRQRRSRRSPRAAKLVQHLHFEGLAISMSAPTFLELYEVPYRGDSDWTIHRGGCVLLEGV
jgi:hypothetical protein